MTNVVLPLYPTNNPSFLSKGRDFRSRLNRIQGLDPSYGLYGHPSDERYYAAHQVLLQPDLILRKLRALEEIWDILKYDPHVYSELEATRGQLLSHRWKIEPYEHDNQMAMDICELCKKWADNIKFSFDKSWNDFLWNIYGAVFHGMSLHEMTWSYYDNPDGGRYRLPLFIADRPVRRFVSVLTGKEGLELRIKTQNYPYYGDALEENLWSITRHMPSYDFPHGVAVFSTVYWPYIFKHDSIRSMMQYIENFALPYVVGYLGDDTPGGPNARDALEELGGKLSDMNVNTNTLAVSQDTKVELHQPSSGINNIPEYIIEFCNREISKAITGSVETAEPSPYGAAQVHKDRHAMIHMANMEMVCDTIHKIFKKIIKYNYGEEYVKLCPRFVFYVEGQANQDWLVVLKGALEMGIPIDVEQARNKVGLDKPPEGAEMLNPMFEMKQNLASEMRGTNTMGSIASNKKRLGEAERDRGYYQEGIKEEVQSRAKD